MVSKYPSPTLYNELRALGYTWAFNGMLFKYLGDKGFTGSLTDRLAKATGWYTHLLDETLPGFTVDVLNNQYALGLTPTTLESLLALTSTSGKTYIDQAGEVIRLRQLVGWSLAAVASASGTQAQARLAR